MLKPWATATWFPSWFAVKFSSIHNSYNYKHFVHSESCIFIFVLVLMEDKSMTEERIVWSRGIKVVIFKMLMLSDAGKNLESHCLPFVA